MHGRTERRGTSEPERIGEFLRRVLPPRSARLPGEAEWRKVVGVEIAAHAAPTRVREGILTIAVDSAPLFQELSAFHGDAILERLRRVAPQVEVRRIRFRLSGPRG
jgi:predicted nucleic acid-binding Zn ribbon protein